MNPEPLKRVLVNYRSSGRGRTALSYAVELAHEAGAPLTVVSVLTKEPTDIGCARCRQSAVIWNREMRQLADEELREAADTVHLSAAVEYVLAEGKPAEALRQAAERSGADLIVLPFESRGPIQRLFSSTLAERLRRPGHWRVVVAPAAPFRDGLRVGAPAGS